MSIKQAQNVPGAEDLEAGLNNETLGSKTDENSLGNIFESSPKPSRKNDRQIFVLLVGIGQRTTRKALPAMQSLIDAGAVRITGAIDPNPSSILQNVPSIVDSTIEEFLGRKTRMPVDMAYVAVPHATYTELLPKLFKSGINVLKEKPLAINYPEAARLAETANLNNVRLGVSCARRFSKRYRKLLAWLPRVGSVKSVQAVDKIVVPNLDHGWRAHYNLSGGGVVIDLGYHLLDQLVGLFGPTFEVNNSTLLKTRSGDYDVEDTAHLSLVFEHGIHANIVLSRASFVNEEVLEIYGDDGMLKLTRDDVQFFRFDRGDTIFQERYTCVESTKDMLEHQFASFIDGTDEELWDIGRDLSVMKLITAIYSCAIGNVPRHSGDNKWRWPRLTPKVQKAVTTQLHTTLSIYDNSGVFADFESTFRDLHRSTDHDSHVLLHNSGTNALHAMYYSAGIGPGDEVIVPVYTFHATVSPLMQYGATPVFVDALEETGNIDPEKLRAALRSNTKAVVVTHMWGIPCVMEEIVKICTDAGVLLLEDCSHAHGASVDGKVVGTFGDGSAWSIQGDKVITGGEGGVSLTPHKEMYYRQLIHGHYNKRCKKEIPLNHHLQPYALTGAGLKNRAHPLAVAIALTQLRELPVILAWKSRYANEIINALRIVPFLVPPRIENHVHPAWYALVFRFNPSAAPDGLTRERYVEELVSRGLADVDIPSSTRPLHEEPLYNRPWEILPHIYSKQNYKVKWPTNDFRGAISFHKSAIKLPVWAHEEDQGVVKTYCQVMVQAAQEFMLGLNSTKRPA